MRFRITYHNDERYTGYKVSIPDYEGGEVVTIDEVEEIEDALKEAKKREREMEIKFIHRDTEFEEASVLTVMLKMHVDELDKTIEKLRAEIAQLSGR